MILDLNYKEIKRTVLSINNVSNCLQASFNNQWLFKNYFKNERRIKKHLKKKKNQIFLVFL